MMRRLLVVVAVLAAASCTDRNLPTAATPVAGPTPPLVPPPLPTNVPGVLSIQLPVASGESATTAFGLTPYGFHGADHAQNGHPGWDIEYRIGAAVRAAAAGTVDAVFPDPSFPDRSTVQLAHLVGEHHYRTVYTNLVSVPSSLAPGAAVTAGETLGFAGAVSTTVGNTPITYAMIHFQLDDLEYHREGPDPKAVSPEPFLSADGKALFDRIWPTAAFASELVEPYATNPRTLAFPASRTWTKAGGDGLAGFRFTRRDARGASYEYALLTESGTTIETGTVTLGLTARPFPTIDLVSPTATRLGIYDIVSGEMRLMLANPGESRPTGMNAASVYRTAQ
jgi:hypothetical protein